MKVRKNINEKPKKIWVDGNTLVKQVGEAEANDYLYGTGFQAKLTNFILERDKKLEEEENAKKSRRKKKEVPSVEPGIE